jgi:pimeloyl-ACP methyl ester carboxylesterase
MGPVISIAGSFATLAGVGFVYQWVGALRDRRRFAGHGRWVKICRRRKIFVREQGSGGPTVVFEAGISATNLNWYQVQEQVSRSTATISYDREGLGWSSPCRTARTPANIARELHGMLERAGIRPPYVLVGHSFGGLVVRRFALLYPDEVAGAVLVDPMRCDEWPPMDPAKQAQVDRGKRLSRYAISVARLGIARLAVTSLLCRKGAIGGQLTNAGGQGVKHVMGRVMEEVRKMPCEVWPMIASHWSRPGFYRGMNRHVAAVPETVREMMAAEPIHDTPVLVLTPEKSKPLSEACLQKIGDNVDQVVVPHSAHWIHLDQPQLVVDSIRKMVRAVSREPVRRAQFDESSCRTARSFDDTPENGFLAGENVEMELAVATQRGRA